MVVNRHGLSRDIPEPIKRAIRQRCGFGCVICGASITHYDHVDPPYEDATSHDADRIALTCPQHHDWITRKFWSRKTLEEASRDPFCKRAGYAHSPLDIGTEYPWIKFAGTTIYNVTIPVVIGDIPLFRIKGSEEEAGPFRLSANFHNSQGRPSLMILDNEWRAYETNWDVEASGGALTIRDGPGRVSLRLVVAPPGGVIVEQLDMRIGDLHLTGSPEKLIVRGPDRDTTISGGFMHNSDVGMYL